jgi:ribosome-binding factor A
MSSSIRQERVAGLLFQELSIIVSSELADPAISLVEVTNVVVTKDLRTAKVYVHHRDEEVSVRALLKALKHATPYVRGQIAERCGLRMVPDVYFYYDDTPSRSARVDELLRRLAAEKAAAPVAEAKAEPE